MVGISAEDQSTKINPNTVPAETLRALLVAVGVDQPRAALLAAEMADWRKRSQNSALGGMKLDQYLGHGLPYRSGDHPFASVDEIALVPDMTPNILARLRPWLSVYQEGDMRDPDDASPIGSAIVNARVATNQTPAPQFVSIIGLCGLRRGQRCSTARGSFALRSCGFVRGPMTTAQYFRCCRGNEQRLFATGARAPRGDRPVLRRAGPQCPGWSRDCWQESCCWPGLTGGPAGCVGGYQSASRSERR